MEYFPAPLTLEESRAFLKRLLDHFEEHGLTYYAVDLLDSEKNIGFIGLAYKDFESDFTPAVDMGYRLKKAYWGKGYCTEGAQRCVEYGFNDLNLDRIIAFFVEGNVKSENVMKRIGMEKIKHFNHPKYKNDPAFEKCVLYEIKP